MKTYASLMLLVLILQINILEVNNFYLVVVKHINQESTVVCLNELNNQDIIYLNTLLKDLSKSITLSFFYGYYNNTKQLYIINENIKYFPNLIELNLDNYNDLVKINKKDVKELFNNLHLLSKLLKLSLKSIIIKYI